MRCVVLVACCVCSCILPQAAADVLDQQNVFVSAIGDTASGFSLEVGQTFTVGIAGDLTRIEVYLARFTFTLDDVILSVYDTLNALPDTFLGSVSLPATSVSTMEPNFVNFDVSSLGITADVGDQLAFAIKSTGGDTYIIPYSTSTFYNGGDPVSRILTQPPSPWTVQPGVTREYGFKTYMDAGAPNGDFNGDMNWNCTDVNALVVAIVAGTHVSSFDMTGDGLVNQADLDAWLVTGGANNPVQTGGNAFLKGDGNLDGVVDGSDFNIWNSRKFTVTPAWCSGDFNADGVVDGSDFNIWNSRKFTSSHDTTLSVPEPAMATLVLLGMLARMRARK